MIGGKPSTSAPRGADGLTEFWESCEERERAIDDWEERKEISAAEDLIDGKITFLRLAVEIERINEEADTLRRDLSDNCKAKAAEDFPQRRSFGTTSSEERVPTRTSGPVRHC